MKAKLAFATSAICICSFINTVRAETATTRIDLTSAQTATYDGAHITGAIAPAGAGGAISNIGGTLTIGDGAIIEHGFSNGMGSAIFTGDGASTTIGNNAIFNENNAVKYGGIMNTGSSNMTIGDNAKFLNNYTSADDSVGATILNQESVLNVGKNALFQGNIADTSGAAIYQQVRGGALDSQITIGDGTSFLANTANNAAAIYNYNAGTLDSKVTIGKNSNFNGNHALAGRGGAVANWFGTFAFDDGAVFLNNTSTTAAGALINEGYMTFQGTSSFQNNSSTGYAGAVANINAYSSTDTYVKFNGNATFTGNIAGTYGGAIVNDMEMTFGSNATFTGNTAGTDGGAIYNTGTLDFMGNVTFSGNLANGALNDIYNLGAVSFAANSHVIFDGGVVNGDAASSITFGDNSLITVKLLPNPTINAGTINIGTNVTIHDLIVGSGLVGKNIALTSGTMNGDFVFNAGNYDNMLYNIAYNGNGLFDIVKKSDAEIVAETGASVEDVTMAQAIIAGTSKNATFNAIHDAIETMLQTRATNSFDRGIAAAKAFAPTKAPLAQSNTTQSANQVFSVIGNRLAAGERAVSAPRQIYGMSSGDMIIENVTLWATGLFNLAELHGKNSFDSNSWGIAGGLEFGDRPLKFGLGYTYTSTEVNFDNRDTDISSNSVILYGQYKPANTYINLVGSYTISEYKEHKHVIAIPVNGKNDVYAIAAQGMVGHDMYFKDLYMIDIITPEVGLRYINIDNREYTDSAGTVVAGNKSDILTGVAKLNFNATQAINYGVNIKPTFSVALTYDMITDDSVSVVTLANGNVYSVDGEALSRFGGEVEVGFSFVWDNGLDIGIGYMGKFRDHYTDHTGIVNLRYKF